MCLLYNLRTVWWFPLIFFYNLSYTEVLSKHTPFIPPATYLFHTAKVENFDFMLELD